MFLSRADREIAVFRHVATPSRLRLEFPRETASSEVPGESQGQGSLVGCRLWGRTESDMTEVTQQQQQRQQGTVRTFSNYKPATGLEKISFIPTSKKDNANECSNYHTIHSSHMLAK